MSESTTVRVPRRSVKVFVRPLVVTMAGPETEEDGGDEDAVKGAAAYAERAGDVTEGMEGADGPEGTEGTDNKA